METGNPVSDRPMIIAIDGPAGAGKSTVTRQVAERLGILYLDTGAMYRAATVTMIDAGVDVHDTEAVAECVGALRIDFDDQGRVRVDGTVVPEERIRTPAITKEIHRVADNADCRAHLVALQRGIVAGSHAALEGRDATTVICPHAPLKIFLTASPEERARRRLADWSGADAPAYDDVVLQMRERDARDENRSVGPLKQADDAVRLETDGLTPEAVIARIIALAVQRRPLLLERLVTDQVQVGRNREPGYVRVAEGSITDPPAPWQLGLTNPSPDRLPDSTTELARNAGGRQAGVVLQGQAMLVLAGREAEPGRVVVLPMLPQTWYVIEPETWHAVVQTPGTVAAWAEASGIDEQRAALNEDQLAVLASFRQVYLP